LETDCLCERKKIDGKKEKGPVRKEYRAKKMAGRNDTGKGEQSRIIKPMRKRGAQP